MQTDGEMDALDEANWLISRLRRAAESACELYRAFSTKSVLSAVLLECIQTGVEFAPALWEVKVLTELKIR
jgi:hypothetical protein